MHRARFSIPCASPAEARILHDAVAVEAADGPEGTQAILDVNDGTIDMTIEAKDVSSLRAAMQGVLRLLDAASRTA